MLHLTGSVTRLSDICLSPYMSAGNRKTYREYFSARRADYFLAAEDMRFGNAHSDFLQFFSSLYQTDWPLQAGLNLTAEATTGIAETAFSVAETRFL